MATISLNVTDTAAQVRATTLAALVTAAIAKKIFYAGATSTAPKKYLRLGDYVLELSTQSVSLVNFTSISSATIVSSVNEVLAAIEKGNYVLRGNLIYIRIQGVLCLSTTSVLPS